MSYSFLPTFPRVVRFEWRGYALLALFRSVCCHGAETAIKADDWPRSSLCDRKVYVEKLWQEFFSDPSKWWDHRAEKDNPKYPDFKHRKSQQALWLSDYLTPPWVDAELAALAPGTLRSSTFSWNVRLRRYVKAGDYKKTMDTFQQMQREAMVPDKFTFIPVLNACSGLTALEEGRRIHLQIRKSGFECNIFVASCLVDMYAKCGSMEDARRVFKRMPTRNVVSWTALIVGYVKCGQGQEALRSFKQMQQEGVHLDPVTFVGVLNACASIGALEEGRRAHKQIKEKGYQSNIYVASSLVDMYAKCGSIEDARSVFRQMPTKDVFSWTAMLGGYCRYGYAREAFEHFERMCQEIEVNAVSFVSLLSACSHGGLVDEGMHYFESMSTVFHISPTSEHYVCVVDLLGRAGHLHEAENMIRRMTCGAVAAVWMSLLGACRVHGNLEMGERVSSQVLVLDPGNASVCVQLANLYAAAKK